MRHMAALLVVVKNFVEHSALLFHQVHSVNRRVTTMSRTDRAADESPVATLHGLRF